MLSSLFNSYLDEVISYSYNQILRRVKDFNLYIRVKNYFKNSNETSEYLEKCGYKFEYKNLVLTRDFFKVAKEGIKNTRILFDALNVEFTPFSLSAESKDQNLPIQTQLHP